ncbi:hypothetical protein BXY85_3821 [Roseivirga pacifica]|uniref:DNA alkylation repair enzyme n=1 Tax=Roseivirga pacifica TaxID=1267423 RepID=A0A1I0Q6B2_9BACT|nr:hypothetical protein [Roseivirga pacifica]RKQ43202.1 hypothetical protein BXY85_3821 [Roseivirga pacifica]SEW22495.1 hypothetical protein SAMN05216290_2054 [Roseivirga pacifica]
MDIEKQLNHDHSKENTTKIVEYIVAHPERLSALMKIFLHGEWRLVQRSAWVVGDLARKKSELLIPYWPEMIENLKKENLHDAVKRNTVRTWQELPIPEDYFGEVAEICFGYLADNKEPIAVKCFSMTVLEKIVFSVPELKDELKFLIEEQLPYGSAGFKNRGSKVLKSIAKL